jgi:hypothetical protein
MASKEGAVQETNYVHANERMSAFNSSSGYVQQSHFSYRLARSSCFPSGVIFPSWVSRAESSSDVSVWEFPTQYRCRTDQQLIFSPAPRALACCCLAVETINKERRSQKVFEK